MSVQRLQVIPQSSDGYAIILGEALLARADTWVKPALPQSKRIHIITDTTVAKLHLDPLAHNLQSAGFAIAVHTVPPGEGEKSFTRLEALCTDILRAGCDRNTALVALGGGVVGDLTGLAAALLLRGLPCIQIPTTLVGQADSSVGGKTAIDLPQGKNLIGVFHQPKLVLCDSSVLSTLPRREWAAGLAEVIKYAIAFDPDFLEWLEANMTQLLEHRIDVVIRAVAESCRHKAAVVAADEKEQSGRRALLNLGHTFAHALEAALGYDDKLKHGEAVGAGLVLAARLSEKAGFCRTGTARRVAEIIDRAELPSSLAFPPLSALDPQDLVAAMRYDKKVQNGKIRFVLLHDIGDAFFPAQVDARLVLETLSESRNGNRF